MSGLTFDHVCDPTSMFQDSFSLSEFILGQQEDDSMESSEIIKEEIDSEEEFHEQVRILTFMILIFLILFFLSM